jgi:hypothetical protein
MACAGIHLPLHLPTVQEESLRWGMFLCDSLSFEYSRSIHGNEAYGRTTCEKSIFSVKVGTHNGDSQWTSTSNISPGGKFLT